MPSLKICSLTLLLLLSSSALMAAGPRVEVEVRGWDPDASGGLRVEAGGFGTLIDLQSDIGLEGDPIGDFRLTFHPSPRTLLRLSRVPLSYAGDQVVSRSISFGGETFTVSTRVASRLEMDYVRAAFGWQFLSSADNRFRIGPIIEARGFEGDASLSAPDLVAVPSVVETFEAAFGSAGLIFDLEPTDRVHFFGEFGILVGSDKGDQTDFEMGARVKLWSALHLIAGYRSIDFKLDDAPDFADLSMDGAFLGLSARF